MSQRSETDSLWFVRTLVRDLTGDGTPDTLALRAFGQRSDSLTISFTITSGGAEVFRESWGSSYELIDPPLPPNPPLAAVDSLMRKRLEAEFTNVHVEDFDKSAFASAWTPGGDNCQGDPRDCISWNQRYTQSGGPKPSEDPSVYYRRLRAMPFDTAEVEAIAADMLQNTKSQITLSYGYETTTTIAWSTKAHRFFTLNSCC